MEKAHDLTLGTLLDLAYDTYLPGADLLMTGLMEAAIHSEIKTQEAKDAISLLKDWDFRVSVNSVEMTLTRYYLFAYYKSDKIPPPCYEKPKILLLKNLTT